MQPCGLLGPRPANHHLSCRALKGAAIRRHNRIRNRAATILRRLFTTHLERDIEGARHRPDIVFYEAGEVHIVEIKVTGSPIEAMERAVDRTYNNLQAVVHPFVLSPWGEMGVGARRLLDHGCATTWDRLALSVDLVKGNSQMARAYEQIAGG